MNRSKFVILIFGVFLISFGVISFEISLTRIFSVMFSYHYVFLAVSLALFGLGLGGVLTRVLSWQVSLNRTFTVLASISLVLSFAVSSFTLAAVYAPESGVMGAALLMFLPFLIAGFLLSAIYRVFVAFSSILYFVDLLGAALGALGVVILLNSVGPIEMVFIISMSASLASLLFGIASRGKKITLVALAGIILMAFFVQFSTRYDPLSIRPREDQFKEEESFLADQSAGARIVESRWSAFGRTDVVELNSDPHSKVIFVDGGAGTRMFHFSGDFNDSSTEVPSLKNSTQYFPYYFVNKGSALVIGPGGGIDVLTSLMGGMDHTTAIEVNPDIVGIVRDYSDYNGGIYTQYSNVHVDVDEGRSFVRRSTQKYDIIMLDIPITKTSQGTIGYALAENYLFTVDSFVDFLDHLNDDGVLSVVAHEPTEVYKLTSIAFRVLGSQGLNAQEIMRRIVVIEGRGSFGTSSIHFEENAIHQHTGNVPVRKIQRT